jgi:hypothetical protein
VPLLIEISGNTELFPGEGFWSAASFPSGTGSNNTCGCSLPDQVSLKLSQSAKDVENQLTPTGGSINVLCQSFEANPSLLKSSHGGNEVGEGRPSRSKRQTTRVSPRRT